MVKINNLSFIYKDNTITHGIQNINLQVKAGELVLLCGESGCGKTTLLRLINGLVPHFFEGELTGEVLINGVNIASKPVHDTAKQVGTVFQNPRTQFFNVDTTSELVFGCENMGWDRAQIANRLKEVIKTFSIEPLMDTSIFQLSGGEKQKIACASVYAPDAPVILLDEPSSSLDYSEIEQLKNIMLYWKRIGKTVIVAEHRLYYLKDIVDKIYFFNKGVIEETFTAKKFFSLSDNKRVQRGLRCLDLSYLQPLQKNAKEGEEHFTLSDFNHKYKKSKQKSLLIERVTIPKQSIIAIVGKNGAGKSTFSRCFCGLEKRCKGTFVVSNKTFKIKQRLNNSYMVMQDVNHQLFTESVLDEVMLSMAKPDTKRAERILSSLDLTSVKQRHPMSLSGGQKQRVAIAGAIASERDYIFFDEPTSGLDLRHMLEVSTNIQNLSSTGKTIFVITHDMELIFECCTYVLELVHGEVAGSYPLDEKGFRKIKRHLCIDYY